MLYFFNYISLSLSFSMYITKWEKGEKKYKKKKNKKMKKKDIKLELNL